VLTGTRWWREGLAGPVCHGAIDPDRAGMRLDETLSDPEAESDAAWALAGTRQTDERLEDALVIAHRDARPVVADLEADVAIVARHADRDLRSSRREFRRVLDQVREDLLDLDVVELNRWQIFREVEPDRVPSGDRPHSAGNVLDKGPDIVPCLVGHERPILDP